MSALAVVRPRGSAPGSPARTAARATTAAPSVATGRLRLVTALVTIGTAAGALFMAVGLNAAAAQAAVLARQLESDVRTAERRHAELLVAVTELEDPARIRARALELGMVPAPAARHLVLRRAVPADGAPEPAGSAVPDPLKPVLTQER
jgi:hypothetical protein